MNFDDFLKIIMAIGLPTLAGCLIYIGRKLQILDNLDECVKIIKKDCKQFGEDIILLKREVFGRGASPLRLKDKYREVLVGSDVNEQIIQKEQEIIDIIQNKNSSTRLDAQDAIDDSIDEIMSLLDIADLKNKMYHAGLSAGAEKVLIALYLYEIIIPKLKF